MFAAAAPGQFRIYNVSWFLSDGENVRSCFRRKKVETEMYSVT